MGRIIIISLLLSVSLFAEGGSNYTSFGLGDLKYNSGAAYDGQGGVSAAMPSENHINLRNPALWAKTTRTILQFGYDYNQGFANTGQEINFQTNGSINNFLIQFSLDTAIGLSGGVGIFRSSNIAYSLSSRFAEEIDGLLTSGQLLQIGSGGLNTAYIGGSISPLKNLSFGIMATYNFGTIEDSTTTIFNSNRSLRKYRIEDYEINGANVRAGAYYSPTKNLSLGAFIETGANIEYERRRLYLNEGFNSVYIEDADTTDGSFSLPQMIGGGISYKIDRYRVGADYWVRDFSGFSFSRRQGDAIEFDNSMGVSLGFSRERNSKLGASTLDKITFRGGLGYNDLYYQVGDQSITEMFLSGGFSTRIGQKSMFDYSVMIGTRGENAAPIFNETFIRMNFNVSISETWFVPFRKGFDDLED